MATIATAFAPPAIPLAYIGPAPTQQLWQTPIPRGEVAYVVQNGAVTISGVGDDQMIAITCTLPRGFGYVLADATLSIVNIDVDAWDDSLTFRLRDSSGSPRWTILKRFEASSNIINLTKTYELFGPRLAKVIVCDRSTTGQLLVSADNLTTNQAAGTINFFARFWQFDLNQSFFWAVNSPYPVR